MTKQPSTLRRWLKRIAIGLLTLLAVVVGVGTGFEFWSRSRAARQYPAPGKLVDIGGRKIQVDCRGTGSPIVVFESGLDINGSLSWSLVHDSIALNTRACAYSRAGIMWSDDRPGTHNSVAVAEDLHAALTKAGEAAPYVLVGHSLGGPYIMTYTKHYPADVAGLVFVDASHPDQVARFKEVAPQTADQGQTMFKVIAALSWTGVVRVAVNGRAPAPHQRPEDYKAMAAFASTSLGPMLNESDALGETMAEAGTFRQLGDRPIVVLSAMAPMPAEALAQLKMSKEDGERFQTVWKTLHDEETSWSSRGRHELVPDATHYIQMDRPDVVIAAVRSVIDSVRARPAGQ